MSVETIMSRWVGRHAKYLGFCLFVYEESDHDTCDWMWSVWDGLSHVARGVAASRRLAQSKAIEAADAYSVKRFASAENQKAGLRYTEEVPTEIGWYWYKNGSMEVVVKFDEELQHHAVQQRKKSELAGKPGPFWAGPIPTPEAPQPQEVGHEANR